jgi:protein-disulfide isomerase
MSRLVLALVALFVIVRFAHADEGWYPLKADDGSAIANHRVPVELESQIEKLPGVVVVGNPHGDVTLNEFYDLNCPYCRAASEDIAKLVASTPELRLVLVPFPVLGVASIQGTLVELSVAQLTTPQKFYQFHQQLYAGRGVIDGQRALAAAKAIGVDSAKVIKIANGGTLGPIMQAHVKLGDALAIQATPGFVIKGVAIVGYPGPKSLAAIVAAVENCGAVVCSNQ